MTYSGTDKMSDRQLVSILLGGQASTKTMSFIADMIVTECELDYTMLARESGIGPATIVKLDAALELGRRIGTSKASRKVTRIQTPQDVVELLTPRVKGKKKEIFFSLILDTKNNLMRVDEISVGSLNASIVHPRELFREAVKISAGSVVIAHNHPSGDPHPSGADIQLTRRLVKAGDVLGIEVLDHVVIGDERSEPGFASLREEGLM